MGIFSKVSPREEFASTPMTVIPLLTPYVALHHLSSLMSVSCILARALEIGFPPSRMGVWLLWDDGSVTPCPLEKINHIDNAQNPFDMDKVKSLMTDLKLFYFEMGRPDPDDGPKKWWNELKAEERAKMQLDTQRCRHVKGV